MEITRSILESANAIMATYHPTVALRSLDAIHLGRRRTMRFLAIVHQRRTHARRRGPHGLPAVTAAGYGVSP